MYLEIIEGFEGRKTLMVNGQIKLAYCNLDERRMNAALKAIGGCTDINEINRKVLMLKVQALVLSGKINMTAEQTRAATLEELNMCLKGEAYAI